MNIQQRSIFDFYTLLLKVLQKTHSSTNKEAVLNRYKPLGPDLLHVSFDTITGALYSRELKQEPVNNPFIEIIYCGLVTSLFDCLEDEEVSSLFNRYLAAAGFSRDRFVIGRIKKPQDGSSKIVIEIEGGDIKDVNTLLPLLKLSALHGGRRVIIQ